MCRKLPVTFVVYRQKVHQEHIVCHGIHPKYFHLESWKHSPDEEKTNMAVKCQLEIISNATAFNWQKVVPHLNWIIRVSIITTIIKGIKRKKTSCSGVCKASFYSNCNFHGEQVLKHIANKRLPDLHGVYTCTSLTSTRALSLILLIWSFNEFQIH